MPLIILGVLVFGGVLALIEISRNMRTNTASVYGKPGKTAQVIHLPQDIEREKRRRNIL